MPVEMWELVKAPWWSKLDYVWRRKPDNSTNTPGRAANRLRFALAAHNAYGKRGFRDGIPAVAAEVRDAMLSSERVSGMEIDYTVIEKEEKKAGVSPDLLRLSV